MCTKFWWSFWIFLRTAPSNWSIVFRVGLIFITTSCVSTFNHVSFVFGSLLIVDMFLIRKKIIFDKTENSQVREKREWKGKNVGVQHGKSPLIDDFILTNFSFLVIIGGIETWVMNRYRRNGDGSGIRRKKKKQKDKGARACKTRIRVFASSKE